MTMFNNSYETGACLLEVALAKRLEVALKKALISGDLKSMKFGVTPKDGVSAVFVSGLADEEASIEKFIHPIIVTGADHQKYLVSDIRPFKATSTLYPSEADFEKAVKNKSEYALVKNRAVLELRWITGDATRLLSRLNFAGSVFGTWIAQSLTRVYALDMADQTRLTALGIYYYHTLFTNASVLEGHALDAAVIHTINTTKMPAKDVYTLFEDMPEVKNINDFCEMVKAKLQNLRLVDFNLLLLVESVKFTWYGTNAKELIKVALEYPPAWIAIVHAALTERTYHSSQVYKLIEVQAKRSRNVDEFLGNYRDLILDLIVDVE